MIYLALPLVLVLFLFWVAYGLVTHDLKDDDE